jgi:hypothetical protein
LLALAEIVDVIRLARSDTSSRALLALAEIVDVIRLARSGEPTAAAKDAVHDVTEDGGRAMTKG